jgi:hypothetical protein
MVTSAFAAIGVRTETAISPWDFTFIGGRQPQPTGNNARRLKPRRNAFFTEILLTWQGLVKAQKNCPSGLSPKDRKPRKENIGGKTGRLDAYGKRRAAP